MKVSGILAKKGRRVITIEPQQSIMEAVTLLSEHRIGALVVLDASGKIEGILSERDIIWRAATDRQALERQVGDLMTREVVVAVPQDDLLSVSNTMTERRFRHVPIVDDKSRQLMGIISIGDILKAQRDAYRGEIDTLETQILADEE